MQNLRIIGVGLHTYAADNGGAFPTDNTAQDAFRRIYVQGNLTDPLVFDCESAGNGVPTGTPGINLSTPSADLANVDYQYNNADLNDQALADTVIASSRPGHHSNPAGFNNLHVAGNVSQSETAPSGTFA